MVLLLFAVALFVVLLPQTCRACTTVVIGKGLSSTGHVIVGHNEDDAGCLASRHGYVPAAEHPQGATIPAEEGYAVIPQAPRTHGFFWSELKGAKGGLTTADTFFNDQGVYISSDSCGISKADVTDASRLSDGGIGYNLRRIVAERACSARDALRIATELVERYGYVPSARAYIFADADEAWFLQIVSGKHYAAQHLGDDEAAVIPNYYTIHQVNPADTGRFLLSPGLIEHAVDKGWYAPANGDFDFAAAYQADATRYSDGNRLRSEGGYSILLRRPFHCDGDYPFSVRPGYPISPATVMEVLRTHYEGTLADPDCLRAPFPGGAPHDTEFRRICTGSTVESDVVVFGARERPELTTMWLSPGRPCELPYMPIHPFFGVPRALDAMKGDAAKLLESHLQPEAGLLDWRESGFQAMRDYQNAFELVYQEHHDEHTRWLWAYEAMLAAGERELQEKLASLCSSGDLDAVRKYATEQDQRTVRHTVLALNDMKKDLAPLSVVAVHQPSDEGDLTQLVFDLPERIPMDGSIVVTKSGTNARTAGIRPLSGSLKRHGNGWSVIVETGKLNVAGIPGFFDYWLGGRDTKGRSFGGQFFFRVH